MFQWQNQIAFSFHITRDRWKTNVWLTASGRFSFHTKCVRWKTNVFSTRNTPMSLRSFRSIGLYRNKTTHDLGATDKHITCFLLAVRVRLVHPLRVSVGPPFVCFMLENAVGPSLMCFNRSLVYVMYTRGCVGSLPYMLIMMLECSGSHLRVLYARLITKKQQTLPSQAQPLTKGPLPC